MPCASAYLALAHRPARLCRERPMATEGPAVCGQGLITCSVPVGEPRLCFCSSPGRRSLVRCRRPSAVQVNVLCSCPSWHGAPSRVVVVGEENSPFRLVDVAGVSQGFSW